MRSSKYLSALLLTFALSACSLNYTAYESVAISGPQPADIKLEFAKNVALRVWTGDLKSRLKTEIPELKDKNLDTMLGIQWVKKTNTNIKDVTSSSTNVFVKCAFKSKLPPAIGQKAVAICIDNVKQEIEALKAADAI